MPEIPRIKFPKVTVAIAVCITLSYLALSSMAFFSDWKNISLYGYSNGNFLGLITYPFVHSSYAHLIANLAIMLAAGFAVESVLKKRDVLVLFFVGSAFSASVFCLINPEFNLVGASAGAFSLLSAAIISEPEEALGALIITAIIGYLIISGVNIYIDSMQKEVELQAKEIGNELIQLESTKEKALQSGNQELLEQTEQKLNVKIAEQRVVVEEKVKIEKGIDVRNSVPINFEIHLLATVFGACYVIIFRRRAAEDTARRIHHLLRP